VAAERLNHWAVIRLLPNMQRAVLCRFYKASDAEGYAKVLRQLEPKGKFIVVFDPPLESEIQLR
jgi:hypothetical protein